MLSPLFQQYANEKWFEFYVMMSCDEDVLRKVDYC